MGGNTMPMKAKVFSNSNTLILLPSISKCNHKHLQNHWYYNKEDVEIDLQRRVYRFIRDADTKHTWSFSELLVFKGILRTYKYDPKLKSHWFHTLFSICSVSGDVCIGLEYDYDNETISVFVHTYDESKILKLCSNIKPNTDIEFSLYNIPCRSKSKSILVLVLTLTFGSGNNYVMTYIDLDLKDLTTTTDKFRVTVSGVEYKYLAAIKPTCFSILN